MNSELTEFMKNCYWGEYTCTTAAYTGQLECLKYMIDQGCEWYVFPLLSCAASNGHLHILKYIYQLDGSLDHRGLCTDAAETGQLECLRWLHETGFSWSVVTFSVALAGGHTECVEYLRANGCPEPPQN